MKDNLIKKIFIIATSLLPSFVFAESTSTSLSGLITSATDITNNILVPMAFSLCLFYFFWGIAKYVKEGAASDKAAAEGRRIMLNGLIGMFVAFSIWGIIKLLQTELLISPIEKVGKSGETQTSVSNTFIPESPSE